MQVIGLMSGTSLDGIDAALAAITGARPRVRPLGFNADALEVYAFALLAWAAAVARPAALPAVTGVGRAVVLGQIVPGLAYRGLRLAGV